MFPKKPLTLCVFVCVSAVRMASSGSTRELALKTTSSPLFMTRNGKQWSQFHLGSGRPHFCEFIAAAISVNYDCGGNLGLIPCNILSSTSPLQEDFLVLVCYRSQSLCFSASKLQ